MDEFALSRGSAEKKVKLYRDRPLVILLVEGLIVGAPIIFWDSRDRQVAHVCRISHLDIDDAGQEALLRALSSSLASWMGLRDAVGVQVLNPSVFICSSDVHEAYELAESCMDKAWLDITALSLFPWYLSHTDEGSKLAAGATWSSPAPPEPIRPPPTLMPPALCASTSIRCALDTSQTDEVTSALLTAASWLRRGRNERNLILKFLAYWIALDSCFRDGYKKRYKDIEMLFGFLDRRHLSLLTPAEKSIVDALHDNKNEIGRELAGMHGLRNSIVHNGQTNLALSQKEVGELGFSCYLLRHEIVVKCTWVLRDATEKGIQNLDRVWPESALHFVLSAEYRTVARSFGASFFRDGSREQLMAGPTLY